MKLKPTIHAILAFSCLTSIHAEIKADIKTDIKADIKAVTISGGTLVLKDPFGGHFEAVTYPGPNANYQKENQKGDTNNSIKLEKFQGSTQGNAPWCWACCASMVLYHQGLKKTPCQIVTDTLNKNCCSLFASPKCWTPGNVQYAINHYGIPTQTLHESSTPLKTKLLEVLHQLKKGQPTVLILLQLGKPAPNTAGAHSIVVYGIEGLYQKDPRKVKLIVYDPVCGSQKVEVTKLYAYTNGTHSPVYRWAQSIILPRD